MADAPESSTRPRNRARAIRFLQWLPAVALSIAFGIAVGAAYAHANGGFDAPDDSSNYATAQALVEDGRPWLDIPAGLTDQNDLLHQRGFTTRNDRAVPIQPLLTSALHAVFWKPTGSFAVSAGLFAALALFGWVFAASKVGRLNPLWATLVPAIAMPLLFWLTRQYFTASTYLLFLPWSLALAVMAWERKSWRLALAAGALHGLALAARPDFAVAHALALPLVAACAWSVGAKMPSRQQFAAFAAGFFVLAGPLVLGVNTWLLGSPFKFGYDSANSNPRFAVSPPEPGIFGLDQVLGRLFPLGVASSSDLIELSSRYLIQMMPWFPILACIGLGLFCWRRRPAAIAGIIVSLGVFAFYVIISHTNREYAGSTTDPPSPASSMVRYYLPVIVVMAMFLSAGVSRLLELAKGDLWRTVIAAVLCPSAAFGIWLALFGYDFVTLFEWSGISRDNRVAYNELFGRLEENAFVVTPWFDRYVVLADRQSIAWYPNELDVTYRPRGLAETLERIDGTGAPVYIVNLGEVTPAFRTELCERSLTLVGVPGQKSLLRLVRGPVCR